MATATATRKDDAKEAERAAKAKDKERAAKAKEKEKAAQAKEKEKAAKAKEKERAAKQKEKERAAKAKEKEKAAKAKEKEKAAKAKEKERAAKAKDKEKAAKAKEKAAKAEAEERAPKARRAGTRAAGEKPSGKQALGTGDTKVRKAGYIAESLGKADAVTRSTKRPSLAASYTTRDHEIIQAWAESRGGVPADVRGTGDGASSPGVLRIEFRDPGDDLEQVSWDAFFATFDDSDVDFLYQEHTADGSESRFFKIVRADS